MQYGAEVKVWPLRPEYHVHNMYFQIRVKQVLPAGPRTTDQMLFSDSFADVEAAKSWAESVLVAYFNWPGTEAREAVTKAEADMLERNAAVEVVRDIWYADNLQRIIAEEEEIERRTRHFPHEEYIKTGGVTDQPPHSF